MSRSEGYDPEYDRDEYSRMAQEEHAADPVRWKAKGELEITYYPIDPRTGEELHETVLWLKFGWTHMNTTPDDAEGDIMEDLQESLPPATLAAADQLLGIDLTVYPIDDAHLVWEVDD